MRKTIVPLLSLIVTVLLVVVGSAMAEESESYFSKTELQLHLDFNREPFIGEGIFTVTVEHFSEWKYGDIYCFVDFEGQPEFSSKIETTYYEIAPRLSLDRILGQKMIPLELLGELYITVQYNNGLEDYINRVWLSGLSVDFNFQPNYGYSNFSVLLRHEKTQDVSYQLTYVWGQPFELFGQQFSCNGFADYWQNDSHNVFLTEPQLRYHLSNLFGEDSFLSNAVIGSELEISHDFFGKAADWQINPTLFFAVSF